MITFTITPPELLAAASIRIVRARGNYYTAKYCPFCRGGCAGDQLTFIVHQQDGNFKCTRAKCARSGNFWQLIELFGLNPRDYVAAYSRN